MNETPHAPPPQMPPPAPPSAQQQTRQWALFLHLSQLAGYLIPLIVGLGIPAGAFSIIGVIKAGDGELCCYPLSMLAAPHEPKLQRSYHSWLSKVESAAAIPRKRF